MRTEQNYIWKNRLSFIPYKVFHHRILFGPPSLCVLKRIPTYKAFPSHILILLQCILTLPSAMLAREFRLWSDDVIVSHIDTMFDGRGTCSRAPHVHPSRCQQSEASHVDPRLGEIGRTGRASQMERRYNAAQFASLSSAAFSSARYGSPRYASPRRAADLSRALVAVSFFLP